MKVVAQAALKAATHFFISSHLKEQWLQLTCLVLTPNSAAQAAWLHGWDDSSSRSMLDGSLFAYIYGVLELPNPNRYMDFNT